MAANFITLHLRDAAGATHDLVIPGPVVGPPKVRAATAVLYSPQSASVRSAGAWVPKGGQS